MTAPVAVIGSGIAGLVTALALAPLPVVLITREGPGEAGSTALAQGGIAAALGPGDDPAQHLEDTLRAGAGLCDPAVAGGILREAPGAIAFLERHGVRFDRDGSGALVFGLEAAHGQSRILHAAGDGAGAEICRALVAAVRACPSVELLPGCEIRRLVLRDGRVAGVLTGRGQVLPVLGAVMATGGIGGLYEATTNPAASCGQGAMIAARAGASLADMEFVQFHPTALALGQGRLPLISEAVRGEGAVLIDQRGERFLAGQPGADLAPRDIVARAIHSRIAAGGRVFLDARGIGPRFASRFPAIAALCHAAGIDPVRQPIPVRPAAHYHMGGIWTDPCGRSTIEGLWAVGECAATGLHGANRLASNSLPEAVVMGLRAARDIAERGGNPRLPGPVSDQPPPAADLARLRRIVSAELGILRDGDGLRRAVGQLVPMAQAGADAASAALCIAVFAALRRESRGAHCRVDFPEAQATALRRRLTLGQVFAAARDILATGAARAAELNGVP